MKNKKFKLDLNKEVISNLQAKQITGGGTTAHSDVAYNCPKKLINFVSFEKVQIF